LFCLYFLSLLVMFTAAAAAARSARMGGAFRSRG